MKLNQSNKISAYDAKTNFSRLLRGVQEGEKITILKHNVPIALVIPMPPTKTVSFQEIIEKINQFRKGKKLNSLSINALKNEGRK